MNKKKKKADEGGGGGDKEKKMTTRSSKSSGRHPTLLNTRNAQQFLNQNVRHRYVTL